MARVIYGTQSLSTATEAVQFSTDTATRVMVVSVHARTGNSGYVYLGSDSNVSSASGWELGPNEEVTWRYKDSEVPSSIPPSKHWVNATDTSQKADWTMILEN